MSALTAIKGNAWVFGNHVDTDVIIPATYLVTSDPAQLALHCMEGAGPGFIDRIEPGDIIVAGENFGCGSSREHAPVAIKGAGISCVLADSFARIFFRNAVNIGLPVYEVPGIGQGVSDGDKLEILAEQRTVRNLTTGKEFNYEPYPDFLIEIIDAGGLIPWVRKKV
jgi:3-isopropylmalate/(R)-2-methylmalate dehydratase small subunit